MKKWIFAFLMLFSCLTWAGPFDNERTFGSSIFDNPTDREDELEYDDSSNETLNEINGNESVAPIGDAVLVLVIGGVLYALYLFYRNKKRK